MPGATLVLTRLPLDNLGHSVIATCSGTHQAVVSKGIGALCQLCVHVDVINEQRKYHVLRHNFFDCGYGQCMDVGCGLKTCMRAFFQQILDNGSMFLESARSRWGP